MSSDLSRRRQMGVAWRENRQEMLIPSGGEDAGPLTKAGSGIGRWVNGGLCGAGILAQV